MREIHRPQPVYGADIQTGSGGKGTSLVNEKVSTSRWYLVTEIGADGVAVYTGDTPHTIRFTDDDTLGVTIEQGPTRTILDPGKQFQTTLGDYPLLVTANDQPGIRLNGTPAVRQEVPTLDRRFPR